jgi:ribonuclease R
MFQRHMAQETTRERRATLLLEKLREASGKPLGLGELMQRARIHPGERTEVKRTLRDLARDGVVHRDGKRFSIPGARPAPHATTTHAARPSGRPASTTSAPARGSLTRRPGIVGTLTKHRDGYGFVARLDRAGDDVFVPPDEAAKALDGDLVRIEIVPGTAGRTMGRLVEVVQRRRRWLLGTFHARGASSFVVPADAELEGYVGVPETDLAEEGEVVKVELEPGVKRLSGHVVERVGKPGEPRVEVLRVAYAKGFSDLFPADVREEAEGVPDHVRDEDRAGRRDLTSLRLVTIDGEDARDFDDAVWVERVHGPGRARYRLVVAIADVAHYVRPGSALDAEALRRGTSVYFPAQVLPMLPERLSNGICSLNPDVDRLCMVADLRIDDDGNPAGAEVYEGVMRSAARCTYTEVAAVLAGESVPHRDAFRPEFELMGELQAKLTRMRERRGAIDFDIPESKIVLGEDGRLKTIERRPRNRAHRVVEEFMLAANEAVAREFGTQDLPTVYRIHGLPDEEKLDAFRRLAQTHGFEVPEGPLGPKQLNALLHAFEGHAQQRALNQLLLRAMMQAVYSADNIGHYGLAAEAYLHFTSPIRRYPDLMVHRLLKQQWADAAAPASPGAKRARFPARELEEIATLCSERERAAMQAEREIAAYYAALFMQDKVGERLRGVVASVLDFGIFVEMEPWFVEGLVKVDDLGEGFELDPDLHALVQRRTGRSFRVGDRVEVEVTAANPLRRQIDLALVLAGERVERAEGPANGDGAGRRARPRKGAAAGERRERVEARGGRSERGGGRRARPEPRAKGPARKKKQPARAKKGAATKRAGGKAKVKRAKGKRR